MRILNRPMFRYGGPIREGIMHGMSNGGRTIAGGHQIGTPMGNRTGFAEPSWKFGETGLGKTLKFLNPRPIFYDTFNLGANQLTKFLTGYNPGWSYKRSKRIERDIWDKMRGRDPLERTDRMTDEQVNKNFGFFGAEPGWTTKSMKEGPTKAELELARIKEELAKKKVATTSRFDDTAPIETQSMKDKIAKDARTKRYNDYLEMMGYDRSKRTAGSKALIDTSALIQEATEEAGSLKEADWGKLINKAIQAASTRYDKPEQIREAVGLMTTKAAIEKEMSAEEDALDKEYKQKSIEKIDKDLKGLSIGELIPGVKKSSGKSRTDAAVMQEVMAIKQPGVIATIVGQQDDLKDIKKDLEGGITVKDYIVKKYESEPGLYILDNVVIEIYKDGTSKQLY